MRDKKQQFSQPHPIFSLPKVNGETSDEKQEQFEARNIATNRVTESKEHPIRYCFAAIFAAVIGRVLVEAQGDFKKAENFLSQQKKAFILNDQDLANRIEDVLNDTYVMYPTNSNSSNKG